MLGSRLTSNFEVECLLNLAHALRWIAVKIIHNDLLLLDLWLVGLEAIIEIIHDFMMVWVLVFVKIILKLVELLVIVLLMLMLLLLIFNTFLDKLNGVVAPCNRGLFRLKLLRISLDTFYMPSQFLSFFRITFLRRHCRSLSSSDPSCGLISVQL